MDFNKSESFGMTWDITSETDGTKQSVLRLSMKVGDLVRFKVHHYHKSYGVGIILEESYSARVGNRHWALFNGEHVMVRLDELELISASR